MFARYIVHGRIVVTRIACTCVCELLVEATHLKCGSCYLTLAQVSRLARRLWRNAIAMYVCANIVRFYMRRRARAIIRLRSVYRN